MYRYMTSIINKVNKLRECSTQLHLICLKPFPHVGEMCGMNVYYMLLRKIFMEHTWFGFNVVKAKSYII